MNKEKKYGKIRLIAGIIILIIIIIATLRILSY